MIHGVGALCQNDPISNNTEILATFQTGGEMYPNNNMKMLLQGGYLGNLFPKNKFSTNI